MRQHDYLDYFDLSLAISNTKKVINYAKRYFLLAIPKSLIIVFLQNNNDIAVFLDHSLISKWAGQPDYMVNFTLKTQLCYTSFG